MSKKKKSKKYTIEDEKLGKIEVEEIVLSSRSLVFDPKKGMVWKDTEELDARKNAVDNLLRQGNAYRSVGNLEQAAQKYEQALKLDSKNIGAKNALGIVLGDLGFFEEAESLFMEILETNPELVPTINCLTSLYIKQQIYNKAKISAEKAVELAPNNEHTINNKINVLEGLNLYNALIVYAEKALTSNKLTHPDKIAYAYYCLTRAYSKTNEYAKAIKVSKKGLEIARKHNVIKFLVFISYELALLYFLKKKYSKVIETVEPVLSLPLDHPGLLDVLGDAYFQQKKYEEALRCYRGIKINNPQFMEQVNGKIFLTRKEIGFSRAASSDSHSAKSSTGAVQTVKIKKSDIDLVKQLIGSKESITIQWLETKTGFSKTKLKLIALDLDMKIYYDDLRQKKKK